MTEWQFIAELKRVEYYEPMLKSDLKLISFVVSIEEIIDFENKRMHEYKRSK